MVVGSLARHACGLGLTLGAVLALAACSGQTPETSASHASADYRPCRSADLALKRLAEDARSRTVTYRFENRSASICVLRDHAQVSLIGLDGRPLPVQVTNYGPDPAVARRELKVVLRPGRRAAFKVIFPARVANAACRRYVKLTAAAPRSDWGLDTTEAADLCGPRIYVSTFWADTSAG
jgi:hypothetical protein